MKFMRSRERENDKEQVTITCLKDVEICCVTKEVASSLPVIIKIELHSSAWT